LFAEHLFLAIVLLSQVLPFLKYQPIHKGNIFPLVFAIVIHAAFVAFLLRDIISGYFGISVTDKKNISLLSAGIAVAFIWVAFYL